MQLIQQCEAWALKKTARIVFPDALDVRAIDAANQLIGKSWGKPILLANPLALRDYCKVNGIQVPSAQVLDPTQSQSMKSYVSDLCRRHPELSTEAACSQLLDPLWYGAMMLVRGDADYCIAGNLSTTASVLRAALRVIGLARGMQTLSSVFFMIAPDRARVLAFGDCGVVPEPSSEQLADIAISTAASFSQATGQVPRVAMLSFSTLGSVRHAAVEHVARASALARARQPDLLIDGEMQFDSAFVPQVATQKAPNSVVAGQANVFIFPSLSAGNIAYKIAERMAGYSALGPMIQGLALPMHDLSRGCSASDMVQVSLLAMKMAPIQSDEDRISKNCLPGQ